MWASLVSLFLASQGQIQDSIDRAVLEHMAKFKAPGCAIAVISKGRVEMEKGYGLANVEADSPVSAQTVFRIGSITKPFTAEMVMHFVEVGKIKLDDPIGKYLPTLPPTVKPITVRELLQHRSGLPNYTDRPDMVKLGEKPTTPAKVIELAVKTKPAFRHGQGFAYSNTNYIVLGELVAKYSHQPWTQALRKHTLALGLSATQVANSNFVGSERARGYNLVGGKVVRAPHLDLSWAGSAGAVESTVSDLVTWVTSKPRFGLKPLTEAQMYVTGKKPGGGSTHYGLGWVVREEKGVQLIGHTGAIPGFESVILRVPERDTTIVCLLNMDQSNANALAKRLLGIVLPEFAEKEKAMVDSDPDMSKFLKEKLEKTLRGELSSEEMTPEFAKVMTPRLMQDIKGTLGRMGPLSRFDLIESTREQSVSIRTYLIEIGPAKLTAKIAVTPDRKLAGLTLKG